MNAAGHLTVGTIVALASAPSLVLISVVVFTSLLPDIDHPTSTLGKYNPFSSTSLMRHRGHCHSLFGIFILSLPFLYLSSVAYGFAVIGCMSHLFSDKVYSFMPRHSRFQLKLW